MKLQPCKEHFHGANVCLVGAPHAEMEWLLTESEGHYNLIKDLLAFEWLIFYILYKIAVWGDVLLGRGLCTYTATATSWGWMGLQNYVASPRQDWNISEIVLDKDLQSWNRKLPYGSKRINFLSSVSAGIGTCAGTGMGIVPTEDWLPYWIQTGKTPGNFTGTRISSTCFVIPIKKIYYPCMYLAAKLAPGI